MLHILGKHDKTPYSNSFHELCPVFFSQTEREHSECKTSFLSFFLLSRPFFMDYIMRSYRKQMWTFPGSKRRGKNNIRLDKKKYTCSRFAFTGGHLLPGKDYHTKIFTCRQDKVFFLSTIAQTGFSRTQPRGTHPCYK